MPAQLAFLAATAAVLVGLMINNNNNLSNQLVQMEARMDTRMVSMGSQFASLNSSMHSMGGQMTSLNSSVGSMGNQIASMGSQIASMGNQIISLNNSMVSLNTRVVQMEARFGNQIAHLIESVDELLASTLTPTAAQVTLACAKASVYILFLWKQSWNDTLRMSTNVLVQCSAFAYREHKGGGTSVVSASHCFANVSETTSFDATRLALARDTRVKCGLLKVFTSDSAVLRCEDAPPLLVRSGASPVFAQAVVAAGFFNDKTGITTALSVHDEFSMHVVSTNIAVSMGPEDELKHLAGGGVPLLAVVPPQHPFGMLHGKLLQGMSGGPVMDVRCGVVGIISQRTINTAFTNLDEVDAWLLQYEASL